MLSNSSTVFSRSKIAFAPEETTMLGVSARADKSSEISKDLITLS